MIKYSHVRLLILCDAEGIEYLTNRLGIEPSEVQFDNEAKPPATGLTHTWCLDSPMDAGGDPTDRLTALADAHSPMQLNRLPIR